MKRENSDAPEIRQYRRVKIAGRGKPSGFQGQIRLEAAREGIASGPGPADARLALQGVADETAAALAFGSEPGIEGGHDVAQGGFARGGEHFLQETGGGGCGDAPRGTGDEAERMKSILFAAATAASLAVFTGAAIAGPIERAGASSIGAPAPEKPSPQNRSR